MRKDGKALEMLRNEAEDGNSVSTTVINLCELYAGAYGSRDPQRELEKVNRLTSQLQILELNEEASRKYGELSGNVSLKRNPIGDFDLIIASIAISFGEPLATRNDEHFKRVPGLDVSYW